MTILTRIMEFIKKHRRFEARTVPTLPRTFSLLLRAWTALLLLSGTPLLQAAEPAAVDFSANTNWFPKFYKPYQSRQLPPPDLSNSKTLNQMIREGKLELSLAQLEQAVVENNLDIAVARYYNSMAQADVLRAKGGQAARGVDAAGGSVPTELFAAAIGAAVGGIGNLGGIGVTGSISGQQRAVNITPRGAFDPAFLMNFSWDRTTSPLNTLVVAGSPAVTPNTTFYQFGWQQAFTSGTSFSVQMSNQRQSTTQQNLIYNPTVISRMSVNLTQQLMSGFGFTVNRRFQTVARNNLKIVREWFRQQVVTTLAQAQNSYWDLVSSQEQVRSSEQALRAAQQLLDDNSKMEKAGTLAPLDVTQAKAEVAARQRDLIVAQTNLQTQEMALKIYFSKEITDALGDASIKATDPLPEPQASDIPPLPEALTTAMQNRPEVPQVEGTVFNNEVAVKFTRNFLKPTFNVFGLFATAGLYGNRLALNSAGGAPILVSGGLAQELTQFIHFKYPEYAVGFALSIPLRNRSATADNGRAQLDERQSETNLERTRNQIDLEVRKALIGLLQTKSQVAAAHSAVEFNQQNLDADQKKLRAGVLTPYDVTLAQRDLLAAELAEVQAQASYAKALVELDRATGTTLEKNHMDLDKILSALPQNAAHD